VESFTRQGYAIVDLLDTAQHARVEELIRHRLKEIANEVMPGRDFDLGALATYHRLGVPDDAHKRMMAPTYRYLKLSAQDQRMLLNDAVAPIFESFWGHRNAAMHYWFEGHQKIDGACVFRVVRPGAGDVSGIHSESSYGIFPLTVWVPIVGFDERYTLKLSPGSHAVTHPPEAIQRNERFLARCYSDDYVRGFQFIRPNMRKGQAIVFHPNLLHGGSDNQADETRVSIEIRVFEANGGN